MARLSKGVLAHDQGLSKSTMSKYMVSEIPPADRLERILEKMGFMREDYEELLSNLSRVAARRGKTLEPATPVDPTPEEWSEIHARSIAVGREAERRFLEAQVDTVRARKTAEAQAEARTLCALLEDDPRPWLSIEKVPALQTWAVAERLADRSAEICPGLRRPGHGAGRARLPGRGARPR